MTKAIIIGAIVKKRGQSLGIVIPTKVISQLKIKSNDLIVFRIKEVIQKKMRKMANFQLRTNLRQMSRHSHFIKFS